MMKCFPCVASLGLGDAADEVMEKKKKNDGEDGAVRKKEPSAPPTSRLGSLGKKIRIIDVMDCSFMRILWIRWASSAVLWGIFV
ncbi:hypothetical protein BHE74_00034980 [Ensete ventricosum]|nr:hypothetical protein BHE74_00034980 [Ensete ventricosum]RZS11352.1 hypothetical protein BHM03_00042672 [Ensete ventricosum]